jgi:hypothetical protein
MRVMAAMRLIAGGLASLRFLRPMTEIRKSDRWKYLFLCILGFAAGVQSAPAQYVEVNAEIVGISRGSNATTGKVQESRRVYHVQCIVGTNRWMMEGDFPLNARQTYWCTGSNIILHTVITLLPLEMRLRQAESRIADELLGRKPTTPPLRMLGMQPKVGEQYTSVLASTDPNGLGLGYNKVPWLAFCSGPFLQSKGRIVPVPIGVNPNFGYLKNYSDSTSVFPDALGLPKRMELRTPDNHLLCEYTVEETTNLLGWTFPMRFKIIQYSPVPSGIWEDRSLAEGKVISIRKGKEPQVPDDVQKAITQR